MFCELLVLFWDFGDFKLFFDVFLFGIERVLFSKFLNLFSVIVLIWFMLIDGCIELEFDVLFVLMLLFFLEFIFGCWGSWWWLGWGVFGMDFDLKKKME